MGRSAARILLVDDDRNFRRATGAALKDAGHDVVEAANGSEALALLDKSRPDLVLCDLNMPVLDGMGLLRALGERGEQLPVIVITAYGSIESAVEAMRAGAFDYVTKPVNREALRVAIERALEMSRLRDENRRLRERVAGGRTVERLLGHSPAMRQLRETLARLAESDVPVLIRGESGVGKELAARALHFDGPRAERGRFVVLNCAAVPGELLESLLFGHRKGAFTGADSDHVGKFEDADGGTLFLDEIGDMPLALQAKLLRVLQEGEIERVGENRGRPVDVRVVAATNQDLERRVEDGAFRNDLYFRLAVVPVEIPPLRERRGDLELLTRHFLARHGAADAEIAPAALEAMAQRSWPGNVRELENLVMRASALDPGLERLEPGHLAREPFGPGVIGSLLEGDLTLPPEGVSFEQLERRLLAAAWQQSGHHQTRGAALLGLTRQTFIYRLQKHGLIPEYGASDGGDDAS